MQEPRPALLVAQLARFETASRLLERVVDVAGSTFAVGITGAAARTSTNLGATATGLATAATVFACPSIYEPLGIVNLEAMACETAVVATATGGIPEVVVPGETGVLVPIEQAADGTGTPLDPEQYVADFAEALTGLVTDPERAAAYGRAGRERAIASFSWDAIAERTVEVYRSVQ